MCESLSNTRALCQRALDDLSAVFQRLEPDAVEAAVAAIARAQRIACYGVGREGLQLKGLAMRLFHLGREVAVVGDMTTPALGAGDLLIVSAGPGAFSTVLGLMGVAKEAGAATLLVTAQPGGEAARLADHVLTIPAQTMVDLHVPEEAGERRLSVLPMGSLFEGAQYVLFEVMIVMLRDRLGVTREAMRLRHTNLE